MERLFEVEVRAREEFAVGRPCDSGRVPANHRRAPKDFAFTSDDLMTPRPSSEMNTCLPLITLRSTKFELCSCGVERLLVRASSVRAPSVSNRVSPVIVVVVVPVAVCRL